MRYMHAHTAVALHAQAIDSSCNAVYIELVTAYNNSVTVALLVVVCLALYWYALSLSCVLLVVLRHLFYDVKACSSTSDIALLFALPRRYRVYKQISTLVTCYATRNHSKIRARHVLKHQVLALLEYVKASSANCCFLIKTLHNST
jgi:hypothetical protein